MGQIVDVFGTYAEGAQLGGLALELADAVNETVSPAACRERMRRLQERYEAADVQYRYETAAEVKELTYALDARWDEFNASFGPTSQGFAAYLGAFFDQCVAAMLGSTLFFDNPGLSMFAPGPDHWVLGGIQPVYSSRHFWRGEGNTTMSLKPLLLREDLVIGREVAVPQVGVFLAPLVTVSSKVYVDVTRLEGMQAKAKAIKAWWPQSLCLGVAGTNALSAERFGDGFGQLLPTAISPLDDFHVLRGCTRAEYDQGKSTHPMQIQALVSLNGQVGQFLASKLNHWE